MVGHLDEPVAGVTLAQLQVSVSAYGDEEKTIGGLIATKPHAQFVIATTTRQFDLL